jgi:predicted RNA binding protein YcfA (HicA-like mRNA interferase family)
MFLRREVIKQLPKKGFEKKTKSHHIYFHHKLRGKYTGKFTKVSHSARVKEISGDLVTQMRKQLQLDSNRQVHDLIECPMTGQDYTELLRQKGIL